MVGVAWDVWGGAASSRFYSTPSFHVCSHLRLSYAVRYVRFGLTVKYVILGRLGPLGGRVHATMASPTRRAQAERRARAAPAAPRRRRRASSAPPGARGAVAFEVVARWRYRLRAGYGSGAAITGTTLRLQGAARTVVSQAEARARSSWISPLHSLEASTHRTTRHTGAHCPHIASERPHRQLHARYGYAEVVPTRYTPRQYNTLG